MDEAEPAFEEILKIDRAYTRDPRAQRSKTQSELKDWYNFIDEHTQEGVINDPLNCWKQELEHNPRRFPTLGRIAFDLFACPAMSSECERVFSRAKQVVTDERSRLKADTLR